MKVLVVRMNKVDDKVVWGILKREGFKYVGDRVMAKVVYGNVEPYIQYIETIINNYGDATIKVVDIE